MKRLKKNDLSLHKHKRILLLSLAAVMLSGCGQVEYPDSDSFLPTFTTTTAVPVIYDTIPTAEYTFVPHSTVTEETTTTFLFGTSGIENDTSATTPTETETTVTTVPAGPNIPDLGEISEIGLSEYYEHVITEPTYQTVSHTVTAPTVTTTYTTPLTAPSQITVPTESSVMTTASETMGSADIAQAEQSDSEIHELLRDGRVSSYTGRNIISHPTCYYSLSSKERAIYDKMVTALLDYEPSIDFSESEKVTFDEIFKVYELIFNYEYRLFNLTTTIEYKKNTSNDLIESVTFKYSYSQKKTEEMQAKIDENVSSILEGVTPQMSDYEIVKHLHDCLILLCTYNDNADRNTIYGVLGKGEAMCQGYTRAMNLLCSLVGIESAAVEGNTGEEHMWNVVRMDGDFYHVDCTWDDPDSADNPTAIRYDYFGLTDDRICELREYYESPYTIPAANGTKYDYYAYNNLVASDLSSAVSIFKKDLLEAAAEKRTVVQFRCADSTVFDSVSAVFLGNGSDNIIGMMNEVVGKAENKFKVDTVNHNTNNRTYVIKVYLKY